MPASATGEQAGGAAVGPFDGVTAAALDGVRRLARAAVLVALLGAATVDGRVRHALGLVKWGPEGAVWIHRWCRRIVRCLGIKYTVEGELPGGRAASGAGFEAVVCNHLSYVDILLMSAVRPFCMVAKTEVKSWPLLGWLTAQAGTVYVARGGRPETYPRVNAAMAEAYRSGLPVLFFPEGTTTNGSEVLPFRRGLFHSVLKDEVQVRTAAVRYGLDGGGTVADDVCWWGDAEFVPHLVTFLGLRGVRAHVRFGGVVQGADRFVLSESARSVVAEMYAMMGVDSPGWSEAAANGSDGDGRRHESGLAEAL
jgi:1-acyl-sn-glycerol-3-phosphate acyltransferase